MASVSVSTVAALQKLRPLPPGELVQVGGLGVGDTHPKLTHSPWPYRTWLPYKTPTKPATSIATRLQTSDDEVDSSFGKYGKNAYV